MKFSESELAIVRRAFAAQMLALVRVTNPQLERAFASVRREAFVGPPPWYTSGYNAGGYRELASEDPVILYQDILLALSQDRGVNNGSPSLHAHWLDAAGLQPGERVAHIGCGAGYYSALLAELVGPGGHVLAVEFDPELAALARQNLADRRNVEVVVGDGAAWPLEPVDCVYVNFSVTRPADTWLEHLRPGGRLIFPLGVPGMKQTAKRGRHAIRGTGLRVQRRDTGFAVTSLGNAFFVCAEGALAGTADDHAALMAAFDKGGVELVRSLRWRQTPSPDRSWFVGAGWSLGYEEV